MTFVKIYCEDAFLRFAAKHPKVKFDAYVDDLTLSASADTDQEVCDILTAATKDLLSMIQDELFCEVAHDKSAVVASS
jgi:hypothetical protein